jgi:hypothetical protein
VIQALDGRRSHVNTWLNLRGRMTLAMDLIWIAGLAVFLVLAFAISSRRKEEPEGVRLFRQQDSLFTPAERSFLGVLDQACAGCDDGSIQFGINACQGN